jgi:hypothetical protein
MNGPVTAAVVEEQGSVAVPGDLLAPLVHRVRLSGSEWRLVIALLLAGRPVSARQLARDLGLDYGLVKRVARGLVDWRILERTRGGLRVQPDAARWRVPTTGPSGHGRPMTCAARRIPGG